MELQRVDNENACSVMKHRRRRKFVFFFGVIVKRVPWKGVSVWMKGGKERV